MSLIPHTLDRPMGTTGSTWRSVEAGQKRPGTLAPETPADVIFVFAGRQSRKTFGLELLHQARAPRIVLSVARYEIPRFAKLGLPLNLLQLVSGVPPEKRHFFVSLEGDCWSVERTAVRPLGTLGEVEALSAWIRARPSIHSVLVVSGSQHLRRIRMCCAVLLPEHVHLFFLGEPEEAQHTRRIDRWFRRTLEGLVELAKVVLYWLVLSSLRRKPTSP